MPLEISKVVELYKKCGVFLQAKANLLSSFSYNPLLQEHKQETKIEGLFSILREQFATYLQCWVYQLSTFSTSVPSESEASNSLSVKAHNFKSKTQLLSREQQLIKEVSQILELFKGSTDPVAYYDIGKRIKMKEDVNRLLEQIKNSSEQTSETLRPMYHHKLEKEMKEDFFSVYLNETKSNKEILKKTKSIYDTISKQSFYIKNRLKEYNGHSLLSTYRSQFLEQNYDIISKRKGLDEPSITFYCHNISKTTKKIYHYWHNLDTSISVMLEAVIFYWRFLKLEKEKSSTKSADFYEASGALPSPLWKLFEIDKLMNLIKIYDKNLNLIDSLEKYHTLLKREQAFIRKMEKHTKQYLNKISETLIVRRTQLHHYIIEDKKYLQEQCKNQKYLNQTVLQEMMDFVNDTMRVIREIANILGNQFERVYQFHEVSHLLGKITNDSVSSPKSEKSTSIASSLSISHREKDNKIRLFQQFLNSITIFDEGMIEDPNDHITCALGPKLLLHGRIYILEQGIFFQSVFNKKNIFFGRTKVFIPKEDISEVNQTDALIIFPDIVQVDTLHGKVNFHALGSRRKIFNALTTTYFPENQRQNSDQFSQADFNEYEKKEGHQQSYTQVLKPYDMMIHEHTFKKCKLNKFFKRYLSDDEFQIKGKKYETFKNYFLTLVDGLDPHGTPLTPQPPSYFCYKGQKRQLNEDTPIFSERFHTYRKLMPMIPFISKGGDGYCEDKQKYHWVSQTKLMIENDTVIKGFSLTEGMCVKTKLFYQELVNDVKLTVTSMITFDENRSTNSLIKGPTISNVKLSIQKMCETIEKYEKGKRSRNRTNAKVSISGEVETLQQQIESLEKENKNLRKYMKLLLAFFITFYLLTVLGVSFSL